jgi:hypothetical protein
MGSDDGVFQEVDLMTQIDLASETLCFFRMSDNGRSPET